MPKSGEPARLPRWGHVSWDADGRPHLYGTPGYDTIDDAIVNIGGFVAKAGSTNARIASVEVRPPGTPHGTPTVEKAEIGHVDAVVGLDEGQQDRLRNLLGRGNKAPSMTITFQFDAE